MKIALIHLGFMYSGGGERVAIYECLLLRKRGYEIKCLSPAYRPEVCHPELIKEVKVEGLLPRLRFKIPLRDFVSLALSSFQKPNFIRIKSKGATANLGCLRRSGVQFENSLVW